ncbi:hypothetical protein [Pseudosulfitobacter koreensis]|uniref:Uncharacterized protein n=1 Tax=Pseudosulfitobacter koreensis TaxID=2968472 RepID=A0ABT1YYY4_9RHOB|nr:hypothetical protein [Pseudosulfitobacter koreense]MCR8826099.1 hypothetical protein [Pseudosulfitobacter koreense]
MADTSPAQSKSNQARPASPAQARPTPLGIYDRPRAGGISGIEIAAIALSVVWLLGATVFFVSMPAAPEGQETGTEGLMFLMSILAVFMPVGMIWVAATAARASRVMREESQRLQAAIDAIRQAYIAQQHARDLSGEPSVARKLDEIAAAARKTETTLATFHTRRDAPHSARHAPPPMAPQPADDQPKLALGTTSEETAPPLAREDFIRALNFPETAEDAEGFSALRRALKDRPTAQIIQAAQDILTLLSQDGIYMDDLTPDRARPEIWRSFAHGARGRSVAALGGVRDRSSLALTAGRMKQDPIFRDAAHHFLRRFDRSFAAFEAEADDADISALADTRTARAFMLLGRVAGTFD